MVTTGIVIGVLAGVYVLGVSAAAVFLRSVFKLPEAPEVLPLTPEETPAEVAARLDVLAPTLRDAGFEEEARLAGQGMPRMQVYISRFANRRTQDAATVLVTVMRLESGRAITSETIGFGAEFENGLEIDTSNTLGVGIEARSPDRIVLRFPRVSDVATLSRAHAGAVRLYGAGRRRPLPAPADWAAQLRKEGTRDIDRMLRSGWYVRRSPGSVGLGWLGAWCAAWAGLWPGQQLRRRWLGRRERAVLSAIRAGAVAGREGARPLA